MIIPARPARPAATVPSMATDPPPTWTVEQASAYFAASGIPFDAWRLALVIKALSIRRAGEARPGPSGGRGKAMYPVGDLQALHRDLAEWLIRIPDPGPGASEDPREDP